MFTTQTNRALLKLRLDAEHYSPSAIANERELRAFGVTKLCDVIDVKESGYGSLPDSADYCGVEEGIPLIRGGDLSFGAIKTPEAYVPAKYHSKKCAVKAGDVLFLIKGACIDGPEGVALVPATLTHAIFNGSCYRARCTQVDSGFLVAYSLTRNFLIQKAREIANTGISYNSEESIHGFLVPSIQTQVQKYIGDKVRQAERLRAFASKSIDFATSSIEQLIELTATESEIENRVLSISKSTPVKRLHIDHLRHNRTPCASIVSRIDAWHYQPHLTTAYEQIQKSGRCCLLHEIIDPQRDIKGGATPLGADYSQSGKIRFYRTSDVFGLSVRLAETAYITEHQDSELSRSRLQAGDVLLTITGADFGHAGVITPNHLPGNISQHSVRFLPTVDADYLVAYFESFYGQQMLWRQAYGATRPAIDYPGVRCLLIRVPNPSVQKVIGDSVRAGINSREFSIGLVTAAKSLVEALIERTITEDELIHAQTRLEQGDDASDRAILSRLYEGGWHATETRQLFPDLDAYYETLRMVEREQTEVAAK